MSQEGKIFIGIAVGLFIIAALSKDLALRQGLIAFGCVVLVIFLPLFAFDRVNRREMGKNSKKKRITFTVRYLGPTTKAEKTVNLTSYKKLMALLENLSKKEIKYKVDVTYEQKGKVIS